MSEEKKVSVTLSRQGVIAPILRTLQDSIEVMRVCIAAVQESDFAVPNPAESDKEPGRRVPTTISFREDDRSLEDKRRAYLNWLLSKGFQEYARGVRSALEEAHIYISLVEFARGRDVITWGDFQETLGPVRQQAQRMPFPQLMLTVNKGLTDPLHFEPHFLSLQRVRNCLEHRGGHVHHVDLDDETGTLVLSFPRLKVFYERGGEEVEVRVGEVIEGEDGEGVLVHMRMITEMREYSLGERVEFSSQEFHEIGFGCWAFATELGRKLPTLENTES